MADQRIVDYIKSLLSKGFQIEQIRQALLSKGWSSSNIDESIKLALSQRTFQTMPQILPVLEEPKEPSKLWILPVLIAIIVIGGISVYFMYPKGEVVSTGGESNFIDCGTDLTCFITTSQSCNPANVSNTATVEMFGITQTTTTYLEMKGIKESKCDFYIQTQKINVTFPPETSEETVNQQKELFKKLEGRNGTCKFVTADLTAMLSRWKAGNFSTEDWAVADCEGNYFSQQI